MSSSFRKNFIIGIALSVSAFVQLGASAQLEFHDPRINPYTGEPESDPYEGYRPVSSMDLLGAAHNSPDVLLFQAEYAMRNGNYEGALAVIEAALKKQDDDADLHTIYAQALEEKYRAGEKHDPALYNKLIKEWLIVMRDERGPEKGLYSKGGWTTPLGKSMGDEDHALLAASHLYKLTGSVPRNGQSDKKFLAKVLKPGTTSVQAKLLEGKPQPQP